jgi:hypothetical protein
LASCAPVRVRAACVLVLLTAFKKFWAVPACPPKLVSSEVDLAMSYQPNEGLSGIVVVGGYRPVGQFTVTLTEGTKE